MCASYGDLELQLECPVMPATNTPLVHLDLGTEVDQILIAAGKIFMLCYSS